jgi:hypothetical protein
VRRQGVTRIGLRQQEPRQPDRPARREEKKNLATTYSPTPVRGSTIGAEGLNYRVRNGNGCFPFAMVTRLWLRSQESRGPAADRAHGCLPRAGAGPALRGGAGLPSAHGLASRRPAACCRPWEGSRDDMVKPHGRLVLVG